MTTPYVGEIRLFGFSRVPTGWFACDGSLQPIAEYQTLYTLLGTTYGGDGISTFAVPDLRGAVPVHQGTGPGLSPRPLGLFGGTESVTLSTDQIPAHQHTPNATSNSASTVTPGPTVVPGALTNGDAMYGTDLTGATAGVMAAGAIGNTGGSLPHDNTMPTLTANICIAWAGVFPSQT